MATSTGYAGNSAAHRDTPSDFGVIVDVVDGRLPAAGGMALPALDLTYLAEAGCGATRNGVATKVSSTAALADAFVDHSLAGLRAVLEEQRRTLDLIIPAVRAVRTNHSLRYMANVVDGTYEAFVYHSLWLWDLVGPSVILAEAGETLTDLHGRKIDLAPSPDGARRVRSAIAANPALHEALIDLLRSES